MRIGIRGKLFLVSVVLVGTVGAVSLLYFERLLQGELDVRARSELVAEVRTARIALEAETSGSDPDDRALQRLATKLASVRGAHVTIVAADGRVRADSRADGGDVSRAPRLDDKPEIRAALSGELGLAARFSTDVGADTLYAALPLAESGPPRGCLRLGTPLCESEAAVSRLRVLLGLAALLGLGVAVLMSALASELFSRTLRDLVRQAREVARGRADRVRIASSDRELLKLASAFNRLAGNTSKASEKLGRERDRLHTVLESMDEAVLAIDRRTRVRLRNQAAAELLGLGELDRDKPFVEIVRVPGLVAIVKQALAGETATLELELQAKPMRRVLARAAPLNDQRGCVLVIHDLTAVRRLETMRRDFVANVSHELRTPVSVIRANAETLLDGAMEDRERAGVFLAGIHRSATRLGRLIADLLDLSRIEAGRYALNVAPVVVADAVQSACEAVAGRAEERRVTVHAEIDGRLCAAADATGLEQVLFNLLENAVKYAPEGGRITARALAVGPMVRLEVEDDGPGIAPHHRDRVFERFYRVDAGRSRELGGTGLGLSIVKHLLEQMHGRVGVEAAPERGSIFWLELPAASALPRDAEPAPVASDA